MPPPVPVLACRPDGLTDVYRRLTDICPSLRVTILDRGSEPAPGWVRVDQLSGSVEELIAFEVERIVATHGEAPPAHVAASRLLHHYLWSAGLLISGPWYWERRVPELFAADVWIDPPSGDLALRPGRWVPGGESALRDAVSVHVAPVLAAFRPHVRRGHRALWGMAADDLVSGIWYLGRMLGEEARAVEAAGAVLPGDDSRLPGAADFRLLAGSAGRSHWTRTRLGCCLYYAIEPTEACLTCPRTSDAERVRRLES